MIDQQDPALNRIVNISFVDYVDLSRSIDLRDATFGATLNGSQQEEEFKDSGSNRNSAVGFLKLEESVNSYDLSSD